MALAPERQFPNEKGLPPAPEFQPREEFIKAPTTHHAFGLVSFNGSEILRLANFADNVIQAVRRALSEDTRNFREDTGLVVAEFVLSGKPFSGRSLRQEQIILDILTAILSQHYTLLSSIDYGRIYLDKLTLAFDRVITPLSSPRPERRVAFGLSFISSTSLRVVSPPLSLTPAILQVVRNAWPLGVVSEKREGDGTYVFKLKGYSFFQQSTFETDALTHILGILRGMDAHGCALVSSLSLSKRSRIQDFWVFSAPAPPPSSSSSPSPVEPPRRRHDQQDVADLNKNRQAQSHSMLLAEESEALVGQPTALPDVPSARKTSHARSSSSPQTSTQTPKKSSHARSATVSGGLLRKPAPSSSSPPTSPHRPTHAKGEQTEYKSPLSLKPRDRAVSPTPDLGGPKDSRLDQPALPAEYPAYPPQSNPSNPYPVDHEPRLLYSTSQPKEPVYNTVPASAFKIPSPPPPMSTTSRPSRSRPAPSAVPVPIPNMPDPMDPPLQHDPLQYTADRSDEPSSQLLHAAFRDTGVSYSTINRTETASTSLRDDTGHLGRIGWSASGVQKTTPALPIIHQQPGEVEDGAGLARAPQVVDLTSEELSWRQSEKPEVEYGPVLPAPGDQEPQGKGKGKEVAKIGPIEQEKEKARNEVLRSRTISHRSTTATAAGVEVLLKSGYRHSVDVPMTVRDSDAMSTGTWVLIHEPGSTLTRGDMPLPPPGTKSSHETASHVKVIPAEKSTPAYPIPSSGDQAAYHTVKSPKKSRFLWSKGQKEHSKDEEKAPAGLPAEQGGQERRPRSSHETIDLRPDSRSFDSHTRTSVSDSSGTNPRPVTPAPPAIAVFRPETPSRDSAHGFTKGVTGMFRKRGPVEVGSTDKRLSID